MESATDILLHFVWILLKRAGAGVLLILAMVLCYVVALGVCSCVGVVLAWLADS